MEATIITGTPENTEAAEEVAGRSTDRTIREDLEVGSPEAEAVARATGITGTDSLATTGVGRGRGAGRIAAVTPTTKHRT